MTKLTARPAERAPIAVDLPPVDRLGQKIADRSAVIGVIGLGYVGLPMAHAMHAAGFRVVGFDTDAAKIEALKSGRSYLEHLGEDLFREFTQTDRFTPTTDLSRLGEMDAILVCVPTPVGPHNEPDLQYIEKTAQDIGRELRAGQLICLESTTYPGTTRVEFLHSILASASSESPLTPGRDFFVAFSPEREDPGNASHTAQSIPRVVGGLDDESTRLAAALYETAVEQVVPVASAEIAEASKLLENVFRAVNIALVNELKVILGEMGIDVWEVIRAASTKPFGFMPFFPGPGLGGHCIPVDPFYLAWKAKEVGRPTRFIELAGEVNKSMPAYVIERLMHALNGQRKALSGARVLVLGLAYKPNVNDTRESPSFELIERLRRLGAEVDYSDPHVPVAQPVRKHDLRLKSVALRPETIRSYDAVLISTNHRAFDYDMIAANAQLIVDTRDAMRSYEEALGDRLARA